MHRTEGANNQAGQFTGGPPATCLTPEFLNSLQEEVCGVIESAGLTVQLAGTDTKNQLLQALNLLFPKNQWDVVVTNQTQFNALFDRVGANEYKVKDAYKSVLIRNLGVGYECSGPTSFLSGGDTWGAISTNACTHLKTENGVIWNIGDVASYIEINTNDCKLENIYLKGGGNSGAIITRSFYCNASRVVFDNCKVSDRNTSGSFTAFECNGAVVGYQAKFINCSVWNIIGIVTTTGFYNCYNLSNCIAYNFTENSAGSSIYGFYNCYNLANCMAYNITVTLAGGGAYGFYGCSRLSSCEALSITATGAIVSTIAGFSSCTLISSSYSYIIDAPSGTAYGFKSCSYLSSCQTDLVSGATAEGFKSCSYGSACYTTEPVNSGNNYMCSLDAQIANQESTPQVFT